MYRNVHSPQTGDHNLVPFGAFFNISIRFKILFIVVLFFLFCT